MFTEQESDTITFPEISKEVMEEVPMSPSLLCAFRPRACARGVRGSLMGVHARCLSLAVPALVCQVIKYFYYKLRYANEPMPPEFPIEPSMALELLMAANYLDT
jgi:hypothetical protein